VPACVCEECLTRDLEFIVVFRGETCRRCGRTPRPGALFPGEITQLVRMKRKRDKKNERKAK